MGEEREYSRPALCYYGNNGALNIEILDPNTRRTTSKSHEYLVLTVWTLQVNSMLPMKAILFQNLRIY